MYSSTKSTVSPSRGAFRSFLFRSLGSPGSDDVTVKMATTELRLHAGEDVTVRGFQIR